MMKNEGKNLGQKSFNGFIWTFFALFANQIFNIISMAVLSRLLIPYQFGVIGAAMLFIEFLNIINNLGVASSLKIKRKDITITKEHEYTAFTCSLLLGVFVYLVVFAVSWPAAAFFRIPELGPVLRVLGVVFFITSFSTVPKAILSRKMHFKQLASNNTLSQFFGWTVFSIGLALLGFGYWSIVGGRIANVLFGSIGLMIRQPHSKRIGINKKAFKDIFGFGARVSVQNIIQYYAQQSDTIIVGRVMGGTALGIYNRAYSLMAVFANFLGNSLSGVLMTSTSIIHDNNERVSKAFDKLVKLSSLLLLPITTVIMVFAPEIIKLILGNQWGGSVILFQVLAVGTFFRFGYQIGTTITIALDKVNAVIIRQLIYLALVIITVLIGIQYSLTGVAIAVLGCLCFNYIMCSVQIIQLVKYPVMAFIKAHVAGIRISVMVFIVSFGMRYLFNEVFKINYVITLLAGMAITGGAVLFFYFFIPSFYGKENIKIVKNLLKGFLKGKKGKGKWQNICWWQRCPGHTKLAS